ncbi:MAG TPA: glycosyltransferase family 2 protein [Candidatus Koribacter sp.]|jgi:glycosyltransferase involved in cell wall biosynthesis
MNPQITIVTPSYNQAEYLQESLESVSSQGVANVEHLVMDGGSSDGSALILKEFSEQSNGAHLRWLSEKDNGQSDAMNKGFRSARGEIIGWLNADDRYRPGCFEAVLRAFRDHPEADIIYGDYTWIDRRGRVLQLRRETSFSRFTLLYHRVLYVPSTATFFRRRIFDEGNLLDEKLQYAMDYEFFVRLCARGYRFQHVSDLMADFRYHPASKSTQFCDRQLEEQNAALPRYSPILNACRNRWIYRPLLLSLRSAAGVLRYGEKAIRGYYFTQWRPSATVQLPTSWAPQRLSAMRDHAPVAD